VLPSQCRVLCLPELLVFGHPFPRVWFIEQVAVGPLGKGWDQNTLAGYAASSSGTKPPCRLWDASEHGSRAGQELWPPVGVTARPSGHQLLAYSDDTDGAIPLVAPGDTICVRPACSVCPSQWPPTCWSLQTCSYLCVGQGAAQPLPVGVMAAALPLASQLLHDLSSIS
jgi:hypothetical protein